MITYPSFSGNELMASRLLLIRHAATVAAPKLLVGSTDVDVKEESLKDLVRFQNVLKPFAPEEWFCSPMKRARQTTDAIMESCGFNCELTLDERLREIDFGQWEMKSVADISREEPDVLEAWSEYDHFVFPGGESVRDFNDRVADVFSTLRRLSSREICVVTHGGVIRVMICLALGLSPKNYLLYNVSPGSLTVIDLFSEGGVLAGLNL